VEFGWQDGVLNKISLSRKRDTFMQKHGFLESRSEPPLASLTKARVLSGALSDHQFKIIAESAGIPASFNQAKASA
jgi:hypothetical protein